jgi:NTP pyrophosphatase (non-canonical NTP hydrolase)
MAKLTIEELQNLLKNKDFNPYISIDNPELVLLHLIEEIGELARALRKKDLRNKEEELGDCMILLCFFAESIGESLEYCTLEKIRKNIITKRFIPSEKKFLELKGLWE